MKRKNRSPRSLHGCSSRSYGMRRRTECRWHHSSRNQRKQLRPEAAPWKWSTVIIAMGSGFSTLDPGYVYEKYPQLIVNACYENLI